jgi:cellulose synthase/poly-beta-1,6-N-acetylglucosamine synthase-like glycosyltransferase
MIGLFSVFEVMEPQGNYMEELYDLGEYKLTWMLCCYFSCIVRLFCIYQIYIFCNFHEIHFGTAGNSLL